jgi:hypothetical protein
VHSSGVNGALGFLALTVPPATYLEKSGNIPYVAPINPGVHPVHLAGATTAQIAESNRDHQMRTHLFDQYNAVEQTLKEQLLPAISDEFIRPPTNELSQNATISVLMILTHLDTCYGHITDDQLLTNKENMNCMWSTADSIDSFWHHIHQCCTLATAAKDPISNRTTMVSVLTNFESSGLFGLDIHDCSNKAEADKTYANFVTHFNKADAECHRQLTARAAGFQGNALLVSAPTDQPCLAAPAVASLSPPVAASLLSYCWNHGFSSHSGANCCTCHPGYNVAATIDNMLGGIAAIQ